MDIVNSIKAETKIAGNKIHFLPIYLNNDLTIDDASFKSINFNKIAAVYITLYPSLSKQVLSQLNKYLKPDTNIFVSSSWLSFDISFLNDIPLSLKQNIKAFGAGTNYVSKDKLGNFYVDYFKQFNAEPETEAIEGYEAGFIAAHVLHRARDKTRQAVLESLRQIKCVKIKTVDKICRTNEGFSTKKLSFFKWTQNGFVIDDD